MCVAKLAQIIQNNKLPISFHCLKKEVSDEVDFLHADKHEILLQMDVTKLTPKVTKLASLQCLYNISKKELEMKLIFCKQTNIKVSDK